MNINFHEIVRNNIWFSALIVPATFSHRKEKGQKTKYYSPAKLRSSKYGLFTQPHDRVQFETHPPALVPKYVGLVET